MTLLETLAQPLLQKEHRIMTRDYISIGSSPPDEDCVQVGDPDYHAKSRAECRRYVEAIRQTCGPEPPGAKLAVKSFSHDFGTYQEVVCWYDDEDEVSEEYAMKCESDGPSKWPEDVKEC